MSKLKQKAFAVILGGTLGIMSFLPVFAAEPEVSPHVEAAVCWVCGAMDLYTYRSEELKHTEQFPDGYYNVYEVTIRDRCYTCGYDHTDIIEVHRPL